MSDKQGWFSEGYEKVEKEAERIREAMDRPFIPPFYLRDGDEAKIRFLTKDPLTYYSHFVTGLNRSFTCSQRADCPLCNMGNKPSFKGAFLVLDQREEEFERDGETVRQKNTVKVMSHGIRALKVMRKKDERKGLKSYDWIVTRTGSGTNTQYDFESIEKDPTVPVPDELPDLKKHLAPRDREWIVQKLAQSGKGQPVQKNNPVDVGDEDEGVISFG